ncbi:MAG: hypothetical protein C3F07_09920 [Anaerolineales bacterium]|nr:MAG: hypothetical protein C3F07_09920 [Anaerolineales bacterium]
MLTKNQKLVYVRIALVIAMIVGIFGAIPVQASTEKPKGTVPVVDYFNLDGTLKLDGSVSGSLDLQGWDVRSDAERGPILSATQPALQPGWSALGENNFGDGSINGAVQAIAINGTDVYAGGFFSPVLDSGNTLTADYIAKWDGANWSALGSNGVDRGSLNNWVSAIAISGNDVYVGGAFENVKNNGTIIPEADYITKWDGTNWSALGSNGASNGSLNGSVGAIAISGDDIYVSGVFTDVNNNRVVVNNADYIAAYVREPVTHYVKWDASGMGDGSSWTDAYTDLQSALSAASAGDEIWVAAGTYKPTSGADRSVSFVLKNGVAVYGGFAGTETLRGQRDLKTNVTIMSGNIGDVGLASDNSYHVMVGSNTDNSAILDGFMVTGGNANKDDLILTDMSRGGGMYNSLGSPTVANVVFNENNAIFGGGMYNYGDQYVDHIPVITNVIFSNNTAVEGGGMRNDNHSAPLLTDVSFVDNEVPRTGGGMENVLQSNPTLVNVTFSGNSAPGGVGGGMSNISSNPSLINVTFNNNSAEWGGGMANGTSSPNIVNVTFAGNTAVVHGGGISNESNSNPAMKNTILWGNSSPAGAQIYNESGSTTTVEDSVVQGGYAGGTNIITADPKLLPLADNGGPTPTMALLSSSPAIDAGDDANCPATDQRGVTRPQGSHCDIGAYEYVNQPPTDISLSKSNVDENLPVGTTVGTLSTTDPDAGDTFTYAFCGGTDDASFSLTGNTLKTAAVFNFEAKSSYSICIRSTDSGSLSTTKTFSITVNNLVDTQTFGDVSTTYWAYNFIERLYNAGITGGCTTTPLNYCPDSTVTRAQMAVFLLKGVHGSNYTPPAVGGSTGFADVPTTYWAAPWIKQLAAEGITGGCGGGNFCPDTPVTRAQMAVFLLKSKHGVSYVPPAATGVFADVPVGYWADKWIEQLAAEGITGGCGGGNYCPDTPVTRAQMAVFLVKTFNLP